MPTLYADGNTGTVAIYTGSSNVVANPNADLSRVLFHSDLLYPKIINTVTASATFAALSGANYRLTTRTLFAHGRPGIPFVLGYMTNLAAFNVPLLGSVPTDSSNGFGRWVTLGADATNVYLHENIVSSSSTSFGSRIINCVVHVTDLIVS